MRLVIDTSAVIAQVLDEESADYAQGVFDAIQSDGAIAPAIIWYEIRNALIANERRGRLSPTETSVFLSLIRRLPIEMDPLPDDVGVLTAARSYDLSVYDAAYLELSVRTGLPLATLDKKLAAAVVQAGGKVFEISR